MKHLRIALLALLVVAGFSNVNAQDEDNPWVIGFGINAVDFYSVNNADLKNMNIPTEGPAGGSWYDQFFNAEDNYNVIPSLSRLSVAKHLNGNFSLEFAGSLNKISKIGKYEVDDLSYYGVDAGIKYSFAELLGLEKLEPYGTVGGGYTWMDSNGAGTLNGGAGLNYWFNDHLGLNAQANYKHAFDDANVAQHWQHSFGLLVKFGGKDADGDGVYDKNDACPDVFGLEEFNGCPDTDGDGIIDSEDACPDAAGDAANDGCPDSDGDGVADNKDACPDAAGPTANNGCPWGDADEDGINDNEDKCPNEAGPASNNGCPFTDTDGDGIADKDDNCPEDAGSAANNGCPEVPESVKEALRAYAKTIVFDTGKETIKDTSADVLEKIVAVMKDYPQEKFVVEGHTDNVGSEANNQKLSERRAESVLAYLLSKGVSSDNLSSKGYGESNPIHSNDTREGRRANRRVEIKHFK
ncbi:OmpA family protein [Urechidicola vernalis]|uniref:OmpA family protein n=1 Tax=Urechidicola vernalis TaxID=3075600 RepID=A0ABU2Y959_9FLAO|nr:OmpA family protein [Urechidicola sp. P050]MDT0554189.1 OmpA family protein [Urechidicola sp. P050]